MDAYSLLFERSVLDERMFTSQLELVTALLTDKESPYYAVELTPKDFSKAQSRLKTYVSQLLSNSVCRNITEDFRKGLHTVVSKKFLFDQEEANKTVAQILRDLEERNTPVNTSKNSTVDDFNAEFKNANYIAIITAKPLEIEAEANQQKFSLRRTFFDDFISTLEDSDREFKMYRFNFAVESSARLFWKGLRRKLFKFLKQNVQNDLLFKSLHTRFNTTEIFSQKVADSNLIEAYLQKIVDWILIKLNVERCIVVFHTDAPIFSIPVIAINPAEANRSRLYAVVADDRNEYTIYQYPSDEVVLWRLFVWDRMRGKDYEGSEYQYESSLD